MRALVAVAAVALFSAVQAHAAPLSTLPSSAQASLAPSKEPGEPLVVSGVVLESDGKTRARGVKLHIYQTDANGMYSKDQDRSRARIAGDLTTASDGRYRFTTIRPGHYASEKPPPAHIHFDITAPDGRHSSTELQFADDSAIQAKDREAATTAASRGDHLGKVQPAAKGKDGVWYTTFDIKLP